MSKDEDIVEYVLNCYTEAEDARRPLEDMWDELWQLYQNKQDWSKKASWQTKCFVPKIFTQIFKSSGEIKRAIGQISKLFKMDLIDNRYLETIQTLNEKKAVEMNADMLGQIQMEIEKSEKQLLVRQDRLAMREKCFKRDLENSNFVPVYAEMIETAFLLGLGVIKVLWTDKNTVKYENIDIMNFFICPDYLPFQEEKPTYVIERKDMDLVKLKSLAKKGSPFNAKAIKNIEEDMEKQDIEAKERKRKGLGDFTKSARKVELLEFWGDVIIGDKVEENRLVTLANRKYVIRNHENKFGHGLPPYILTMPIPYPHRGICGVSIVQPMAKLQYLYNNIINMVADNLNFSINKVFEYNPNDLKNPRGLTTIYPGKMIATNTSNNQVLKEVVTSPVGRDAIMFLGVIDKEMQEGTSITKPIMGVSETTRKTKTQHEDELSQAKGTFDIIGRDMECNSIKPLLEMTYDLYSQFMEYEPREEFVFVVGGITLVMTQNQLMEHVREVIGMAIQAPPITQMTDLPDLWKKFLSIYNLQDVYEDNNTGGQALDPRQQEAIQQKAAMDAKQSVSQMSPEEIMNNG